jgi:hypothetical protein
MKIFFLVMGFLFLGASFAWTLGTEDELRLAGGIDWVCEPPTAAEQNTECYTKQPSDTFVRLDIGELPLTVCFGLTGIGFMTAAAAVGNNRAPKPQVPQQQPGPMQYQQR